MRQMFDMQQGFRKGTWTELMKPVVANLTTDDMINIVAYTASFMHKRQYPKGPNSNPRDLVEARNAEVIYIDYRFSASFIPITP